MMKAATGARIFSIMPAAHDRAQAESRALRHCAGRGDCLDPPVRLVPLRDVAPCLLDEARAFDRPEEQPREDPPWQPRRTAELDEQDDARLVGLVPRLMTIAVVEGQALPVRPVHHAVADPHAAAETGGDSEAE